MEIILSKGYDTPDLSNEERTNKELIELVKNDKRALFNEEDDDLLYCESTYSFIVKQLMERVKNDSRSRLFDNEFAYSFIVNIPDETTDFIVEYDLYPDQDNYLWCEEYVIYVVDGKIYKAEEDRK